MIIRSTEEIARGVIDSQMTVILGYINPTNDGRLAAWMVAKEQAERLVGALQTVCDAIAARPELIISAMSGSDSFVDEPDPAMDEAMDELEARQDASHVHPIFAPILAPFRPTKEAM